MPAASMLTSLHPTSSRGVLLWLWAQELVNPHSSSTMLGSNRGSSGTTVVRGADGSCAKSASRYTGSATRAAEDAASCAKTTSSIGLRYLAAVALVIAQDTHGDRG